VVDDMAQCIAVHLLWVAMGCIYTFGMLRREWLRLCGEKKGQTFNQ